MAQNCRKPSTETMMAQFTQTNTYGQALMNSVQYNQTTCTCVNVFLLVLVFWSDRIVASGDTYSEVMIYPWTSIRWPNIEQCDRLKQERRNPIASALELRLSCINTSNVSMKYDKGGCDFCLWVQRNVFGLWVWMRFYCMLYKTDSIHTLTHLSLDKMAAIS